jgi:outer membrane autotransporter protein
MWDSPEFAFNDVSNPVGGGSGTNSAAMLGAAIPAAIAGYGGWIDATGSFAHVDAGDGAPGYNAQTGGFLAGIDKPILPDLSLGVALGYEHFNLNENDTQSNGDVDTGRLDFYGAYNAGFATVSFATGFGYDAISTTRYLPVGIAKENHHGLEADAAAQISRQFQLGSIQLIPSAGFEYVSLTENGFDEAGASGADLANAGHSNASLQPFIGVEASQTFVAESGTKVIPEVHLQYNQEVLNPRRREVVTSTDGTPFPINGVTGPHNIVTAGLGISALTTGNLSVYAKYDISLGIGVSTDQDVSAGLSYKFW